MRPADRIDRRGFLVAAATVTGAGLGRRGIGHNLPQEAPKAFADAVIEADRL